MNENSLPSSGSEGVHVGTWLSIGSPVIAELAAISGFDWLLFDLEHGAASDAFLMNCLQSIRGTGVKGIVRVGTMHPDLIMRALDWGSVGIMLPHVESAEDAEQCLQAIHYSPRGRRGFSRSVRAFDYGLKAYSSDEPPALFFAQIESLKGVEEAERIAAIDDVNVLFVGPSDLARNLAAHKDVRTPSYEECLERVLAATRATGKKAGILIRDITEYSKVVSLGFTYVAIESDIGILRGNYQRLLTSARVIEKPNPEMSA